MLSALINDLLNQETTLKIFMERKVTYKNNRQRGFKKKTGY